MKDEKITIIGAGISGLVAAINLAKSGFRIEVLEKQKQIGGSPAWHPSVHHQTFDIDKTSTYIGINIAPCFRAVRKHIFDYFGRRIVLNDPKNSWVCEKGPQSNSIESYLHAEAKKFGISIFFMENMNLDKIKKQISNKSRCIVSTGLERRMYVDLGIRHEIVQGYRGSVDTSDENIVCSYFGDYTNQDFAYVASFEQLKFALLFARKGIVDKDLDVFKKRLMDCEGIEFNNWKYSTGCIPLEKNIKKQDAILAGTISGMIDPFYHNGISGALISGKIASLYFINPHNAYKEYNYYTRQYRIKQLLKYVSEKMPAKQITFLIISRINDLFRPVGVVQ